MAEIQKLHVNLKRPLVIVWRTTNFNFHADFCLIFNEKKVEEEIPNI